MSYKDNPNFGKGKHPSPPELAHARKLTRMEFELICAKYLNATKEQIKEATKDPNLTMLEAMIVSLINKAIVHGDQKRLDFLLDRLIGKVVQPIEYTPPPPPRHIQLDVKNMPTETIRLLANATERDVTESE